MLVLTMLRLQLKNQKKQRIDWFYLTGDKGEGHF